MLNFLTGYVLGERAASRAATFSRNAGAAAGSTGAGQMYDLDLRVDRLLLVVDAMWSLLRENGYSDEDLAARIRELDESDGVLDGKRTQQPSRCPSCQSMVQPGRATCAFCGAAVEGAGSPMDGV